MATSDFKNKLRRAKRLTSLLLLTYAGGLRKAVHAGDTNAQSALDAAFAAALLGYVDKGVTIADTAGNLKRNPFAALGLLGLLAGDPFADEVEGVRAFCRKWAAYSGVALSDDDRALIKSSDAG